MTQLFNVSMTRNIVRFMLLAAVFFGLLAACAGQQPAQNPAGPSTQDPPVPHLTEATHGILDTTRTVPQIARKL